MIKHPNQLNLFVNKLTVFSGKIFHCQRLNIQNQFNLLVKKLTVLYDKIFHLPWEGLILFHNNPNLHYIV